MTEILAPCLFIVYEVLVKDDTEVDKDQVLIRGEVMKNIFEIVSPVSGVISNVLVSPGEVVENNCVLIIIKED